MRFISVPPRVAFLIVVMLIGVIGFGVSPAQASLINLTADGPDITSGLVDVSYVASSGVFSATGTAMSFDVDHMKPIDYDITNGSFSINMLLTPSGQPTSGTLSILGTIPGLASSGTLLTGQISQFGYQPPPGGEVFEFVFNVNGGDLASYYSGKAGIVLGAQDTGFTGVFTSNFGNSPMSGSTDTFAVPEPSSIALVLALAASGLVAMVWRRSRT
jgi:hypothetical protein